MAVLALGACAHGPGRASARRAQPIAMASSMEAAADPDAEAGPPAVESVGELPRRGGRTPLLVGAFVAAAVPPGAGHVVGAAGEAVLLEPPAELDLDFGEVAPPAVGSTVMLLREERHVRHPTTGDDAGILFEITGLARVERAAASHVRARLTTATREVERGQWAAPLDPSLVVTPQPQPLTTAVAGVILAIDGGRSATGPLRLVFVDRGRADGLAPGHGLAVVDGEVAAGGVLDAPIIAQLQVFATGPDTAVCWVEAAVREIRPGDRVYGGPPAAAAGGSR